jgi:peptidoglycan/xylan/chitin deacetylase (PgdA/CDA1 family)
MKKLLKISGIFVILFFVFFLWYLYGNYTTPILMYHSFDKDRIKDYAAIDPVNFRKQMNFIQKGGYRVISLESYAELLENNKAIPRNLVIITIDDGYKDNLAAINILKEFNYPATIFLIADKIDKKSYLSEEEIANFLKETKVDIGSHTLTHPDLLSLNAADFEKEISGSKKKLTELFNFEIKVFAYPGGAFNEEALRAVKNAGYICACTTNRGFSKKLNRFALRRIKITNRDSDFTFWAKISGFYNTFKKPKKPY